MNAVLCVTATRSPGQLARVLADLQCTNELLLEKNGSLEARWLTVSLLHYVFEASWLIHSVLHCVLEGRWLTNSFRYVKIVSRVGVMYMDRQAAADEASEWIGVCAYLCSAFIRCVLPARLTSSSWRSWRVNWRPRVRNVDRLPTWWNGSAESCCSSPRCRNRYLQYFDTVGLAL